MARVIDVWDAQTFGDDLVAELHANAGLVRNYTAMEREIFLEPGPWALRRTNPHAASYYRWLEDLHWKMDARTIRAWHYTRLTDLEVENLLNTGIQLSTLETLRQRLDAQVATGELSAEVANALFAASPFHHPEQLEPRSDKFCMVSHPQKTASGDVTLLLGNWGGEAVYFWLQDKHLEETVAGIGKPRVIEVAVPLAATRHAYPAAKAVVATFAQTIGCARNTEAFDLYTTRPLAPNAVLAIHTEGESTYQRIADGYPTSFPPRR